MIGLIEMRWIGPYPPQMGQDVLESLKRDVPSPMKCVPFFGYFVEEDDKEYPQDELELMLQFQEVMDKE